MLVSKLVPLTILSSTSVAPQNTIPFSTFGQIGSYSRDYFTSAGVSANTNSLSQYVAPHILLLI